MDINGIIQKTKWIVDNHRIDEGAYRRWNWQDEKGSRKMGVNEYGCADAANILYTIGAFEGDPLRRAEWVRVLREMQNPETGLFYEGTHHTIHTTAHCLAALELFDAQPLTPPTALLKYREKEALYPFLDGLLWESSPWNNSHQGAGLYASLAVTHLATPAFTEAYFDYLRDRADPVTGLGLKGRHGSAPLCHQLYGWFHYFFNHEYAKMPIPYPDKLIDSCITMYKEDQLTEKFTREIGFMEIDWIFAMNRASRQSGYRLAECKELLRDCANRFIPWMDSLDEKTDEGLNDLHMLFGAICALAELQLALPGEIKTEIPLKIVLDRRPFI